MSPFETFPNASSAAVFESTHVLALQGMYSDPSHSNRFLSRPATALDYPSGRELIERAALAVGGEAEPTGSSEREEALLKKIGELTVERDATFVRWCIRAPRALPLGLFVPRPRTGCDVRHWWRRYSAGIFAESLSNRAPRRYQEGQTR
jgi:hypothetical protein